MRNNDANIGDLIGKTLKSVSHTNQYDDQIHFETTDGEKFVMLHTQDCCESVRVEEIIGDIQDLVGNPILTAEQRTSERSEEHCLTATWTFYELATIKGSVTIRWLGESNGYYSERVDFEKVGS